MRAIAIRLTQLYYRQLINKGGVSVQLKLNTSQPLVVDDCVIVHMVYGRVSNSGSKPSSMLAFASIDHIQKCLPDHDTDYWYQVVLRLTHIVESI